MKEFDYEVYDISEERLAVNKSKYTLIQALEIACLELDVEDNDFIICVKNGYVKYDDKATCNELFKWNIADEGIECYLIHVDSKERIFSKYRHDIEKEYIHFKPVFMHDNAETIRFNYVEVNLNEIIIYQI